MKINFSFDGTAYRLDFISDRGIDCRVHFDEDGDAEYISFDDLDIDLNSDIAQKMYIVVSGEIVTPIQIANYAEKMYSAIVAEYEREVHDNDMHERGLHNLKLAGRI